MHFASRWCAKEALRKCKPAYLELDMAQIEVTMDETGKPSLQMKTEQGERKLPVALSLTHTPLLAAAVVVDVDDLDA